MESCAGYASSQVLQDLLKSDTSGSTQVSDATTVFETM